MANKKELMDKILHNTKRGVAVVAKIASKAAQFAEEKTKDWDQEAPDIKNSKPSKAEGENADSD